MSKPTWLSVLLVMLCLAPLEAAGPVINEFVASNSGAAGLQGRLVDEDGDASDWIEIYNPTAATVDLSRWCLTDDADDPTQWRFPEGTLLEPDGYLLVFASGKDRSGHELHTNFKLSAAGEHLALLESDGRTVAHAYAPQFPEQLSDVSYGLGRHEATFAGAGLPVSYCVPGPGDAAADWTSPAFDDADWSTTSSSLGFAQVPQLNSRDIGSPSARGSYATVEDAHVVRGDGIDIWDTADSFYFAYMPLSGDGELSAQVVFMTAPDSWAKAGVMIRETLDPGSRHAMEVVTPGNGVAFQRRATTNGASATTGSNAFKVPYWVRIMRRGASISGYYSTDGVNWALHATEAIDMARDVYIGLCVTSHAAGSICNAVFDSLTVGTSTNEGLLGQMLGVNASVWARMEFEADETDTLDSLHLGVQYEDGFVAYLNGVEVARDNLTGTPRWDSSADRDRPDAFMAAPVLLDLSDRLDLLRDGGNVLAIQGLNDDPSDGAFLLSAELTAAADEAVPQYFLTPTPGGSNLSGRLDLVADPQFSHVRGLYDEPFLLTLSCETPGATIRYSTDGSAPTATGGQVYAGGIPVETTTCIRAAAFRPGYQDSAVQTHTYIFLDQVLRQPNDPSGFPAVWGSTAADYEMDQEIVNHSTYRVYVKAALESLPTMSLVMDASDLFGANGIYTNWGNSGPAWERPGSVELVYPDGTEGFHANCGVEIYGGVGRREDKKSFQLSFKRQYGASKLRYPLFGPDAAEEFDQLVLRANFNDAYVWGGNRSQYIRDEYVRRLQLALGQPSPHGNFVHLYINGLYWGLYNPCERPEAAFAATYFSGDKEDWDALNSGQPVGDSTAATWNAMLGLVRQGVQTNQAYQRLQGNNPDGTPNPAYPDYLDIDNYIDYLLVNFFVGNADWPYHNWYAAMNRVDTSGWKSFSWDAEWVVGMNSGVTVNVTGVDNSLCEPYARLRENTEFRMAFADRAHQAFFNDGPFYVDPAHPVWDPAQPARNRSAALYAELADMVGLAMLGESARWGDVVSGSPYTLAQWQDQRDWVLDTYMPQRAGIVLDQLRKIGLYPSVEAPTFRVSGVAQHGGYTARHAPLAITAPQGTVYYTTDGTDPRLPVWASNDGKTVTLVAEDAPKRVLIPNVANGGHLLGNSPLGFDVIYYKANISVGSLTVAEQVIATRTLQASLAAEKASVINYFNTGSPGNFDGDRPFPGTQLNADVEDFVILATAKVIIPTAGEWTFGVNSDDGFGLTLTGPRGSYSMSYANPRSPGDTLSTFNIVEAGQYDLRLVFYERGGGSELELFAARGRFSSFSPMSFRLVGDVAGGGLQVGEANIWFANYFDDSAWMSGAGGVGFEAGGGNYAAFFDTDVLAEMFGRNASCYARIPFSTGDTPFSKLTLKVRYDDSFVAYLNGAEIARRNFVGVPRWDSIATNSNPDLAAVAFQTIDVSAYAGLLGAGENLLAIHALNRSADDADFLISAELIAEEASQGAIAPGAKTFTGSFPLDASVRIKARALAGTWSALNEATFAVGPVAESLRISEIMYHPIETGHPDDPNAEFIELTNIGAETVNLNLVSFTDGVEFTFPSLDLPPGGYVVVVRDIIAFQARYGDEIAVAGQYAGSLDNAGERIELQDAAGRVIHSFRFQDDWYDLTDGLGLSLTVKNPATVEADAYGDKSTWRASRSAGGSPGYEDTNAIADVGP
ncbi:MAG: lamin tail domain-containing protein [Sedimentisphaerales bacterium]|nr:lamin tail domain-containing protein [Sedimentisphaerales bacterium]